jgi:DNA helicase-2/ATP-dependent DNA helicase PcrA
MAEARYYLADSLDLIRGLSDFKPPAATAEHWPNFEATMSMLRRNAISWPAELDLVRRWYAPRLERLHEDAALR